ncbi:MAG: DUF1553 domain-containing protein, partial [Verrucomicrobiales bacterium]
AYTTTGSGRRELAEDMLSGRNTLTARVIVNRLWHHTFGSGLVASADNFGRLGKEPSHPELLDFLAADLRDHGWSMKRTVKQLVMSRAFRSASTAPAANASQDPGNVFLAYFTPRRLDAEAILDTIRYVANNRVTERAIYTRAKRNALNPFLTTFNYPIPTSTVGVRNLTNVPAQALTLMNGETTRRAASEWSQRIRNDQKLTDDRQRIDEFFMQAYSRKASDEEVSACLTYIGGEPVDESEELAGELERAADRLKKLRHERDAELAPVRARLQAAVDQRNEDAKSADVEPVDLKPFARWDFDGDAKDLIGNMHGEIRGNAKIEDGALVLRGGCVMTSPIGAELKARSLEVLVQPDPIGQRGGGAMVLQTTDGHTFDGIVYAEVDDKVWLSGSDHHRRTERFGGAPEDGDTNRPVRLTITYDEDGTTRAFRNGKPYGKPYKSEPVGFARGRSQILFGMRHGKVPSAGRALTGKIYEARLYDRVLTPGEVAAAASGTMVEVVTEEMLAGALGAEQREWLTKQDATIAKLSSRVDGLGEKLARYKNASRAAGDAYFRIAHAILNSKELIYVY